MILMLLTLFSLGSLLGILYGFYLIYIQVNANKTYLFIINLISKMFLLLIFYYLLHLCKIRSIIFIVSFILSFWFFIINKYKKLDNYM